MLGFTKTIHVLALGLWFGSAIFFSFVVGLALLAQTNDLAKLNSKQQWFVVPAPFSSEEFNKPKADIQGRHEYASRIFGHVISPMFDWYFLLQGVCGFLAVAAAWGWQYRRPQERIMCRQNSNSADRSGQDRSPAATKGHRLRVTILLLAVATVVVGWSLERYVSQLRHVRHQQVDEYFKNPQSESELNQAVAAKANFGLWHTISLFLNFGTIGLVTAAMILTAHLPAVAADPSARTRGGDVVSEPRHAEETPG